MSVSELVARHSMGHPGSVVNGHLVPTAEERTAYQAAHPDAWDTTVKYGYYGLYFIAAAMFLAMVMNAHYRWTQRRRLASFSSKASALHAEAYAMARWAVYARLPWWLERRIAPIYTSGSFAQTAFLGTAFVFCTGWCFGITYYYRPPFYGSSPLGLRSEWLAMAMLPFLFVLAQKRNFISYFTGSSYEKLQVLHQGVAGLHFYMSIVHTVSMSIRGARESALKNTIYTNGFAALAPLFWLCVVSMPIFRTKAYEAFWVLHILAALAYLGLLFWHVYPLLDGPAYMYATFAVMMWGFLLRIGWLLYRNVNKHMAEVTLTPAGAVLVTIPTRIRWSPGQHVLLRFPAVRPLESHPYSLATPASEAEEEHTMRFAIHTQTGFSLALADAARAAGGTARLRVFIDGPFGDERAEMRAYDGALLLAGGSGITQLLPVFLDLLRCRRGEDGPRSRCGKVELIWAMRHKDSLLWFEKDITDALAGISDGGVSVKIYVTRDDVEKQASTPSTPDEEKDGVTDQSGSSLDIHSSSSRFTIVSGRPNIPELIDSHAKTWPGRVGVVACGPPSFTNDCCNSAAAVQLDILAGGTTCDELYMRSEQFSW
ncbi:hypothetical protein AURDEDRAFT_148086 [Auricularia subglabra TFB-10046 SS5]|nr:hypothetical protein AURDEDRAFT_148086 [Auricularia subglabra TFB-10046 SS5]